MEDILALVVVTVVIGGAIAIGRIVYKSYKQHKAAEAERFERKKKEIDDYYANRSAKSKMDSYATAMGAPVAKKPKSKPAMKKANNTTSYANTPMTSSSSTAGTLDLGDVITGALVLNELFGHKSEASPGISVSTKDDTSWGLDDSSSRSSISSSMDTSSSWGSDSSSSDSGPSSDW